RALPRYQLERSREVLLDETIARLPAGPARAQEDLRRRRVLGEPGRFSVEDVGVRPGQDKTLGRQVDCWGDQLRAPPAAGFPPGAIEPHSGPGHPGRPVPVPAEVGDGPAAAVEVHIGARRGGGGFAKVDKGLTAVG